jgi:hypothetical protein
VAEDKIKNSLQLEDGRIIGPGQEQELRDANVDPEHLERFRRLDAIEGFGTDDDYDLKEESNTGDATLDARQPKAYERQRGKRPVAGGPTDQSTGE